MKLPNTFPNWDHQAPQPVVPGAGYKSAGAMSPQNTAAVKRLTGLYTRPAGRSPSGTPFGRMRPYLEAAAAPAPLNLELYIGGAAAVGLVGFLAWKKYG